MKVTVILPAYNEEESLKDLISKIHEVLGQECEVIVINDASTDNTASVAVDCGARVIHNPYNMGNGAAVKRGIRKASGQAIVLMDADGQHNPEEIPKLLEGLSDFDMVVGARTKSAQVFWRKIANNIYNCLASYISGMKIDDLTSGFRAFKKDKAMKFLYLLPNTFSYPSTLTLSFIKAAYSVKFIEASVLPRQKGKSKINLLSDGTRFFVIIMKICVFFSPLKVFLPISLLFGGLGLGYYGYTFFNAHRFTNMSALLLSSSVIILMLGLVSEQIASLRMEKID
ncbi:MAG: glycosyltransferase family 2 protein [Candidatus Omnitrophica bacterium]|nr:glycosyltransferase family 2 protein [Candidatus Omnitrophota bacterium]